MNTRAYNSCCMLPIKKNRFVVKLVNVIHQSTCVLIRWLWAPLHRTQIVILVQVLLRQPLPISRMYRLNNVHLLHGMPTILGKCVSLSKHRNKTQKNKKKTDRELCFYLNAIFMWSESINWPKNTNKYQRSQ